MFSVKHVGVQVLPGAHGKLGMPIPKPIAELSSSIRKVAKVALMILATVAVAALIYYAYPIVQPYLTTSAINQGRAQLGQALAAHYANLHMMDALTATVSSYWANRTVIWSAASAIPLPVWQGAFTISFILLGTTCVTQLDSYQRKKQARLKQHCSDDKQYGIILGKLRSGNETVADIIDDIECTGYQLKDFAFSLAQEHQLTNHFRMLIDQVKKKGTTDNPPLSPPIGPLPL